MTPPANMAAKASGYSNEHVMNTDLQYADSRVLHEPFSDKLRSEGPKAAFEWLVAVLAAQSPGLRSSNAFLAAYTGRPDAIDWIEATVEPPVVTQYGQCPAFLG